MPLIERFSICIVDGHNGCGESGASIIIHIWELILLAFIFIPLGVSATVLLMPLLIRALRRSWEELGWIGLNSYQAIRRLCIRFKDYFKVQRNQDRARAHPLRDEIELRDLASRHRPRQLEESESLSLQANDRDTNPIVAPAAVHNEQHAEQSPGVFRDGGSSEPPAYEALSPIPQRKALKDIFGAEFEDPRARSP